MMASILFKPAEVAAARTFLRREYNFDAPEGNSDRRGCWFPAGRDAEVMAHVRGPSRFHPDSYWNAVRTIKHCAALHDVSARQVGRLLKLVGDRPPFLSRQQLQEWITGSLDRYSQVTSSETAAAPAMGENAMGRD
jgi:hypothetical protein